MSLIDQPIPNLIGGVSQQPPIARYLNQLGECINGVADPVEGLGKRPPLEHIKRIVSGALPQDAFAFYIDRDQDNRFVGLVSGGTVRVFEITTGNERTVSGSASAYLACDNPRKDLRSLTIADYTILLNRTRPTARLPSTAPARPNEGLIFVRAGAYGRTYRVTLVKNGATVTASYTTPDGSSAAHSTQISTEVIADNLAQQITGFSTLERVGSLIYIADSTHDFTITTEDGQGNEALRALKDNIQRFSDLPRTAKEGIVLRIAGDPTSAFDDYWVKFTNGVWEETIRPGENTSWDPSSLPVALVLQPNGTFSLQTLPWVSRAVGDDDSNPFASFEGLPISSLLYYRNRFGFLADENLILSKAGDYFNFFRTTLTQVLADDPIDIAVGDASGESSPVTRLEHAVAFDKKLVLFARNAQYIVDADGGLTPTSGQVDPVTTFACSPLARPVAAGRYIYFAFDRDGASGVREFYVEGAAQTEDAEEVTSQCPTYLPAGIVSLSATTLENTLMALSEITPSKMYIYEFLWSGNEKLQSAWAIWDFGTYNELLQFFFVENVGYAVIKRSDGIHLERIRYRPNLTDPSLPYFTLLDHRVESQAVTKTYSGITQRTAVVLPYAPMPGIQVYTRHSSGGLHAAGVPIPIVATEGNTIYLAGDKTAWSFVVGLPYTFSFEPTRPYFVPPDKIDPVANTDAEIRVRDYAVDFAGTGYFRMVFTPRYRDPITKVFAGTVLGATTLSVPDLDDGKFRMKTPTKNTLWNLRIENDSIFPSNFLAASWRGIVESRSQRIG
jgi:hypothetical protein